MIVHFKKEESQYLNILEVLSIFVLTELIELLHLLGMYDPPSDTYNTRKIFWSFALFLALVVFIGLISITCIAFLVRCFL